MVRSMLVLIVLLISCGVGHADVWKGGAEPPAVFDKRPYAEAKKAAEQGKKWFIVKGTATWCGPCKKMDATTWVDDKVVKWVTDNAVAVALDVDQQKGLAGTLAIEAMPTMIAFKGGKEFDRIVGYKSPAEMLEWLEGIAKGEKSIEAVKKRAAPRPDGEVDVDARYDLARKLAQDGHFELAADEYSWLWQNMLEHVPAMSGVRLSFMAGDMGDLARKSEAARKKFTLLRDRTGTLVQGQKVDPDDLTDWLVLNEILGDAKTTLAWFDTVKDQPKWKPMLERQSHHLSEVLIKEKRWADIARLYSDPMRQIDTQHELLKMLSGMPAPAGVDEATRKLIEESPRESFREKVSQLYASLLAAAREKEAQAFAEKARKLDDSGAMVRALVAMSLEAGQPRRVHMEWLDREAERAPRPTAADSESIRDLRVRLDSALRKPAEEIKPPK